MKFRLYTIFSMALMCYSGSAISQNQSLSLSEAISIGLEKNFDIRIERKTVEVAENNNAWGEAGRMPNVTLNTTYNNSMINNKSGDQFFNGTTFPGFELNNQVNSALTPALNVNWTIFNGNKVNIGKARLDDLQRESEGNAEIIISNTIQAIILGYYIAELEAERLDTYKQQLNLSSDKYEHIKVRSEIGSAVSSDILLEEGNYLNDSVSYINQQLAYRNAVRNLNFLLNEQDVDKDYVFTDNLINEVEEIDFADLTSRLESNNVDLKKLYLSQAILNHNIGIARADRMPRLSVDAGYSYSRSVQDLTNAESDNVNFVAPNETSITNRGTYYANFTLAFTLFNGNKINRAIKNAVVQEDIGNIRIEKLRSSINRDLYDKYDEYNTRLMIYNINKRRVEAAEVNLSISDEKFKTGSINSFDFRTVQNNNLDAKIQLLQSLYNLIDSKVALMRLTGGLMDNYTE
ncbi:TolC family protein [Fulvivirga lutimaris]|uniref:TolC family protein n=1 Tax=Fulvivirga lutimaris TaxID=1819566 RepID=UPI001FEAD4B8|nr:TolC family protein [Fulvivirga lutimaris]